MIVKDISAKKQEIKSFLTQLETEVRAGNFRVVKRRNENIDYLRRFGWTPSVFFSYLCENLSYEDWLNGPCPDHANIPGEIWEFGKVINDVEFYIKIKNYNGIKCLSFHEARKACVYHLKGK
ncbi:hypothetical protein [Enterococcus casseliflavus]